MQRTGDILHCLVDLRFTKSPSRTHRILDVLCRGGLADQKVDYLYGPENLFFPP